MEFENTIVKNLFSFDLFKEQPKTIKTYLVLTYLKSNRKQCSKWKEVFHLQFPQKIAQQFLNHFNFFISQPEATDVISLQVKLETNKTDQVMNYKL